VLAQTPGGSFVGVTLSVILAAATSFVICSLLLRLDRHKDVDLAAATAEMESLKGKKSSVAGYLAPEQELVRDDLDAAGIVHSGSAAGRAPIHHIVFACDAGMGSSAMGASVLRNKIKKAGFTDVEVKNVAIANLTDEPDLIVTHQDLTARARTMSPSAEHVSVDNFMGAPQYDEIVEVLRTTNAEDAPSSR